MIDQATIARVLCAAVVAAVMMPLGHALYPYIADTVSGDAFHALEAVLSASAGFGLYAIFG